MEREKIDPVKISEKYGNKTNQLSNWLRSLTTKDYGYKYLKKEGYIEEQIADWVKRTPVEKSRKPRNKSSDANLDENLLRDDAKV